MELSPPRNGVSRSFEAEREYPIKKPAQHLIAELPRMQGKQPHWLDDRMKPTSSRELAGGHQQEHRLAHLPSFLRHDSEGELVVKMMNSESE